MKLCTCTYKAASIIWKSCTYNLFTTPKCFWQTHTGHANRICMLQFIILTVMIILFSDGFKSLILQYSNNNCFIELFSAMKSWIIP